MSITDAINDVYLKAVGKATAPTTGAKYARIVALLDYYQRRWAREPGVDWNSLYDPSFSIGTVTATDEYDLDTSTIRKLSMREGDYVRIVHDDGDTYTDYTIVPHDSLKDYYYGPDKEHFSDFVCARQGNTLVFNHTFETTDSQYGGEIFVPCYLYPNEITSTDTDNQEVQVDDPDWLTTRTAAEYVRNDITRRQRYPELISESNEIMTQMIEDNGGQIDEVERPWTPHSGLNNGAWS